VSTAVRPVTGRGGCKPAMAGCAVSCLHRQLVMAYREERQRQEALAEHASYGYRSELRDHLEQHPMITFRDWLIGTAVPEEVRHAA
jgi:hypothetical protein